MKRLCSLMAIFLLATLGACTQYHAQGAGAGAVLGGIAGALLDHKNPWRGGVVGSALGAIAGATITDISMRASLEAARTNRMVAYEQGNRRVEAIPAGQDEFTKCKKIRQKVYENGEIISDSMNEVCEGTRMERRY